MPQQHELVSYELGRLDPLRHINRSDTIIRLPGHMTQTGDPQKVVKSFRVAVVLPVLLEGVHYRTEAEPQGAQNALFITSYSAGIS